MIKSAYLEITNACNLNCRYCYNKSEHFSFSELPLPEIKKVISYCSRNKAEIIFSGGEPFLFSSIKELISIVEIEKQIAFHIVTNGTVVPFEQIKNIKNLFLHISLDSINPVFNASTRGDYDHNRVIGLIRRLGELNKRFYVNMVITRKNIGEIADLYRFVVENNGIPQFSFVQYQSLAVRNWSDLSLTTSEKINCLNIIHNLNEKSMIKSNNAGCLSMCPITIMNSKINIAIDVLGRIYPCQSVRSSELMLGNLADVSDLSNLHTKILVLQDIMSKRRKMNYGCDACFLSDICYRGCLSEANNLNNDLFATDGNCDIRRWQYLFLLKRDNNEF